MSRNEQGAGLGNVQAQSSKPGRPAVHQHELERIKTLQTTHDMVLTSTMCPWQAHPGVVQKAGNLLVAKEGDNFGRGTGHDAEVIAQQPVRLPVDWAVAGGGRGQPI